MKTRILSFTLTRHAIALCAGGSIFLCPAAHAELKWDQTSIELHPAIGDKQAVAHFKYENVGKTPVRFKSVHASCGCTTAQTQKEEVPAGEKGEITATFNIGDRQGLQVKQVTVMTDEPDPTHATTVLTLKTNIIAPVDIKPQFVFWKGGEEPKPKTVTVTAAKEFPAKSVLARSTTADFTTKVAESKPGEWKVDIQPKDTSRAMSSAIVIQTDIPKEAPKTFSINAQVMPSSPIPVSSPAAKN